VYKKEEEEVVVVVVVVEGEVVGTEGLEEYSATTVEDQDICPRIAMNLKRGSHVTTAVLPIT